MRLNVSIVITALVAGLIISVFGQGEFYGDGAQIGGDGRHGFCLMSAGSCGGFMNRGCPWGFYCRYTGYAGFGMCCRRRRPRPIRRCLWGFYGQCFTAPGASRCPPGYFCDRRSLFSPGQCCSVHRVPY